MGLQMFELGSTHDARPCKGHEGASHPTLVLAESDEDMWLTVVRFGEPPKIGATFRFLDKLWEIVWRKEFGCGAAPLRSGDT
jgi:hypothetical protein